jgi:hypothetical protein
MIEKVVLGLNQDFCFAQVVIDGRVTSVRNRKPALCAQLRISRPLACELPGK